MSANKAALKAAKAALDARKYEDAAKEAQKVLDGDGKHYHANVFLGLALERLGRFEEAEKVYNAALESKNDDALAWQGLINLYEKQGNKRIDEYNLAARRLAEIQMQLDNKYKCQDVIDKYVGFAKQHGTKDQHRQALDLLLPSGPVYDYLEGRLPHPSQTFSKIAEILEAEETLRMNKLIGERRTRLGARIGQVTTEVKCEIYKNSPLEALYGQIINWTLDDDTRRLYEERLLQRAYDTLAVLPSQEKDGKRSHVQHLAHGLVILKHAFPLAWIVELEWKDIQDIKDFDKNLLFDYMELFPEDGLTKVLRGYLTCDISPFQPPDPTNKKTSTEKNQEQAPEEANNVAEDGEAPLYPKTSEDRLLLMSEGLDQSSRSALSQRLMGEYLLHLEEYPTVVDHAKKLHEILRLNKQVTGLGFTDNFDAANTMLGTALVKFQSPRHHAEARSLFDGILQRKPDNSAALIGVGLILEEEEEFEQATEFLSKAIETGAGVKVKAEAAWCKALSKDYKTGVKELEQCLEQLDEPDTDKNLKAEVLYRIGICLWNIDTSKAARKDRTGAYARFIAALQVNLNHAPSYTSLGIYYADFSRDKRRARKCFQKAFEISSSEVEAAERLARTFAAESDWELVEVVSQRVIDSGKIKPPPGSKRKGLSWPFSALGVCQLNHQDYPKSVVSFQSALRTSPEDVHSWIGLGESYHNSGRYIAATKAFEQAQKLQEADPASPPEDKWFSKYMLANVRRELGDYSEAVDGYESVLALKPLELGVSIALLQTHVESTWQNIELGMYGRAAENATQAINVAAELVEHRPDAFNLWRALGDACSSFTYMEAYIPNFPLGKAKKALQASPEEGQYDTLTDIDKVSLQNIISSEDVSSSTPMNIAILAHKRAIHTSANNIHAQAVAWYNLGWAEWRACVWSSQISTSFPAKGTMPFLKAAVRCFKRAIELEAGNPEFWNALGLVTSTLNPKVAQHAFVRSLHLNDKSAKLWTNLGAFYLLQNDTELANEAFTRGQSADPDYAHAWLGQGILALLLGDAKEASNIFTHAFEISDSSSVVSKHLYASSAFDQSLSLGSSVGNIAELLAPLFAVHQLKVQASSDGASQHLAALLAERVGDHAEPVEVLLPVCEQLEVEYENTESADSLARFAQAKADLARAYLASGKLADAVETAETALDLSADGETSGPGEDTRQKYRLSAHLTSGLAANYQGDMDKAISMFRTALSESNGNPDAVCILAQVLWAKGGDEERNNARELLFDTIEKHPEHAEAITLLSVIAVLDEDQDTLEAVVDDLQGLRIRSNLDAHQKLRIGKLLAAIAMLKPESIRQSAERNDATAAVMLAPSQPHGWNQLAGLAEETEIPADMALLTALGSAPPKGALDATDLSEAFAGTGRVADAQRSVMVAPWVSYGWEALET